MLKAILVVENQLKCDEKGHRLYAADAQTYASLKKQHSVLHNIFPDQSSGRSISNSITSSDTYTVSIER